jgi:hypothetical protein
MPSDRPDDQVWVVWSQDTFGYGPDRDPPLVESVHATEEEAAAELQRLQQRESKNSFIRFWVHETTRAELPPRERWLRK